jgi:hypothetical protein
MPFCNSLLPGPTLKIRYIFSILPRRHPSGAHFDFELFYPDETPTGADFKDSIYFFDLYPYGTPNGAHFDFELFYPDETPTGADFKDSIYFFDSTQTSTPTGADFKNSIYFFDSTQTRPLPGPTLKIRYIFSILPRRDPYRGAF